MYSLYFFHLTLILCGERMVMCMNSRYSPDVEIAKLLAAKGYLPDDKDLPRPSVVKTSENDATYILSKLSDDDLIKLLNEFPKKHEFDMNDIIKVSEDFKKNKKQYINDVSVRDKPQQAVFRLENKVVDPYSENKDDDPKYNAHKKINNMLFSRPQTDDSDEDDKKKEMLFDFLVAQLKTLCCKKRTIKKKKSTLSKTEGQTKNITEYIFLVVNDEIKSNLSDDLIPVDPDSLSNNSSVLVLGPITTPLTDAETRLVVSRITNELSKPEYLPLLKKISQGDLGKKNSDLMKSMITGIDSRRYIKPHRCNYQSKLAKIYGGPKWLICTGYLNLNTPSLYD